MTNHVLNCLFPCQKAIALDGSETGVAIVCSFSHRWITMKKRSLGCPWCLF